MQSVQNVYFDFYNFLQFYLIWSFKSKSKKKTENGKRNKWMTSAMTSSSSSTSTTISGVISSRLRASIVAPSCPYKSLTPLSLCPLVPLQLVSPSRCSCSLESPLPPLHFSSIPTNVASPAASFRPQFVPPLCARVPDTSLDFFPVGFRRDRLQ